MRTSWVADKILEFVDDWRSDGSGKGNAWWIPCEERLGSFTSSWSFPHLDAVWYCYEVWLHLLQDLSYVVRDTSFFLNFEFMLLQLSYVSVSVNEYGWFVKLFALPLRVLPKYSADAYSSILQKNFMSHHSADSLRHGGDRPVSTDSLCKNLSILRLTWRRDHRRHVETPSSEIRACQERSSLCRLVLFRSTSTSWSSRTSLRCHHVKSVRLIRRDLSLLT